MATIQTRVDDELRDEADALFKEMGMTVTDGIRMFLKQSVNVGGLPFQPKARIPNQETIDAINDKNLLRYDSLDELFESWK